MVELLSPVGDFESLKAAVQNGADSVYFGGDIFSARAFAKNFSSNELKQVISYAKLRGVKTNLTLNTLIKDNEFSQALDLARTAYENGIDAIIVQDLGLAMKLIRTFPDLPIHGSTQMTVHNLNGALELQDLGFKRVVLSRELSANEIAYICKNSNIEIECFIHGALCISYSGQCLFSSMLGGRSGNRGKCAGPCRLPFSLLEDGKTINSGYLLSTRDLCGLDFLPFLIEAGVTCFKIEGRMKSPEYVATVTRIYRKYIDLALSGKEYNIEEKDRKDLLQIFNRGMSSAGHLSNEPNKQLVFKEKPNNMGLFLGIVQKYNPKKGHITLKLNEPVSIGDTISLEKEDNIYTISEIMENNTNITQTKPGQTITIGRMKGNISSGDKVFKMSSKSLNQFAKESYGKENRKIYLSCKVVLQKNKPISISVYSENDIPIYKGLHVKCILDYTPIEAKNRPLEKDTVIQQISKTASTPYEFKNISVLLDDNIFLPKLSILNELRRVALAEVEKHILQKISRTAPKSNTFPATINPSTDSLVPANTPTISLLLNIIHEDRDYSNIKNIANVYIPLKYYTYKNYEKILKDLSEKFNLYIYMPTIVKGNYKNLLYNNIETAMQKYNIRGFVISNICNIKLLNTLFREIAPTIKQIPEIIANYTFNVFNKYSVKELQNLDISRFTISPELDKSTISNLVEQAPIPFELIVYGRTPLLNMNYCLLGQTDKCYPNCKQRCQSTHCYELKDRLNMKFKILPDNIQTVTTIFNSKITSINPKDFNISHQRIDILDESIEEINHIIEVVREQKRLEGQDYTNGNLNKQI